MLRGRNVGSPSSPSKQLSPSRNQADIYGEYEADTPAIHQSDRLHKDDSGHTTPIRKGRSFEMDREWAEKGYGHEYEENSVGGTTPKMGMGEKMGAGGRRPLSQGPGLGIWGKGKKKRLG